jgi:hypothetical protein
MFNLFSNSKINLDTDQNKFVKDKDAKICKFFTDSDFQKICDDEIHDYTLNNSENVDNRVINDDNINNDVVNHYVDNDDDDIDNDDVDNNDVDNDDNDDVDNDVDNDDVENDDVDIDDEYIKNYGDKNKKMYIITINNIPYFYGSTIKDTREYMRLIARKLHKVDNKGYDNSYICEEIEDELKVVRNLDFILVSFKYVLHHLKISEVKEIL